MKHSAPLIVTLDGPAGAGKSTLARQLSANLEVAFLDTGAMYRGLSWLACREGVDVSKAADIEVLVSRVEMGFDFDVCPPALHVNGEFPGDLIRTEEVSRAASLIAQVPSVREAMVEAQRSVAAQHPRLVTEGRDQGSVVFPDATVKFYITASAHARAFRRVAQLGQQGVSATVDEVVRDIALRDSRDQQRAHSPLVRPADAIEIDTTNLALPEALALLIQYVERLS